MDSSSSNENDNRASKRCRLAESSNVKTTEAEVDLNLSSNLQSDSGEQIERAIEHRIGDQVMRFIRDYFPSESIKRARRLTPFHRSVRLASCIYEAATYIEEIPDILSEVDRLRILEREENKRAVRAESQLNEADRNYFAAKYTINELEKEVQILKRRINFLEDKINSTNDNRTP